MPDGQVQWHHLSKVAPQKQPTRQGGVVPVAPCLSPATITTIPTGAGEVATDSLVPVSGDGYHDRPEFSRASLTTTAPLLPTGWEKIRDPSRGKSYYHHLDSKTQWERQQPVRPFESDMPKSPKQRPLHPQLSPHRSHQTSHLAKDRNTHENPYS